MQLRRMLDRVRTSLHEAITTSFGDRIAVLRVPKDLARRVNLAFGEPICSTEELDRRRKARARLEDLLKNPQAAAAKAAPEPKLQAPVIFYFEKDRNARMFERVKELLDAKSITYTLLDVAQDASAKDFVMREAKVKEDELPIVFVGTTPVGGYNELVDWDVSGKLAKALDGSL